MKFIIFLTLLASSVSFAAKIQSKECEAKLNIQKAKMDVASSNLANMTTTRTPEGGPYLKQEYFCKNEKCRTITHAKFITEYLPDHVDADSSGYVKFPDISIEDEMKHIVAAGRAYEKIKVDCGLIN